MNSPLVWLATLGLSLGLQASAPAVARAQIDEKQAFESGVDAYVYG